MSLHGLDAELAEKVRQKYAPNREAEVRNWICLFLEEEESAESKRLSFQELLMNGVILCRIAVKLGSKAKPYTGSMPFKQMENISAFLTEMEKVGVRPNEKFQTVDLYEGKNVQAVVDSFYSLTRMAFAKKKITNPALLLGPQLSQSRELSFSQEQLDAGKHIIPMQAGKASGENLGVSLKLRQSNSLSQQTISPMKTDSVDKTTEIKEFTIIGLESCGAENPKDIESAIIAKPAMKGRKYAAFFMIIAAVSIFALIITLHWREITDQTPKRVFSATPTTDGMPNPDNFTIQQRI